jgi:adenine specific DNA methylase Mod
MGFNFMIKIITYIEAKYAIVIVTQSLIQEIPKILDRGKKEAQKMLDGISSMNRITLQTNELVLPTKAKEGLSLFFGQSVKTVEDKKWLNQMIYGDNLFVMQALLAGDSATASPSLRGKIDLIYIDPPFDSKADYKRYCVLSRNDNAQADSNERIAIRSWINCSSFRLARWSLCKNYLRRNIR